MTLHSGMKERLARMAKAHRQIAEDIEHIGQDLEEALAECRAPSVSVPVPEPRQYLTVRDLAHRLQVDEKTIRRWRSEHWLPRPLSVGGILRWSTTVIDDWEEANQG